MQIADRLNKLCNDLMRLMVAPLQPHRIEKYSNLPNDLVHADEASYLLQDRRRSASLAPLDNRVRTPQSILREIEKTPPISNVRIETEVIIDWNDIWSQHQY
jgi:hypothetical protein